MVRVVAGVRDIGAIVVAAYEYDVKYPAAAFAYYAFLSLVPLLLLGFAAFGRRLAVHIERTMALYLTPAAQELFFEALASVSGRTGAVVISLAVLVWAGINIVVAFLTAMARIEGTERAVTEQFFGGAVVLGSLTAAVFAIVATSVASTLLVDGLLVDGVTTVGLLVALTVVFQPMYYVPSRTVASPRVALPGAFVAAAGWTVLHVVIQLYVRQAAQYAIYGALSGIILLLTSLYVAALLLTIGVVVNKRYGTTDPEPPRDETA